MNSWQCDGNTALQTSDLALSPIVPGCLDIRIHASESAFARASKLEMSGQQPGMSLICESKQAELSGQHPGMSLICESKQAELSGQHPGMSLICESKQAELSGAKRQTSALGGDKQAAAFALCATVDQEQAKQIS